MKRLLEAELIFGRLMRIAEPHLVERYNRALEGFRLPKTKLEAFDIDRTGFSPQVADELGDPDYLDPNRINRRFIILTPSQMELPVVHTAFSNTGELVREFYAANHRTIDALTIKDVVFGEIEDSVAIVDDIEDLLSINQVEFKVLSADGVVGKASELATLVDRLKQEPDAWRDDAMLNRMVEIAKVTGDIRTNPLVPENVIFRHSAFWTSHFGGTYIFVDDGQITVVADPAAPGFRRSRPWQVSYISAHDPERVFTFLMETGRLDLPRASWMEPADFLEHRADMLVRSLVHEGDPTRDLADLDTVRMQTWLHTNAARVNSEGTLPFLNAAKRELAQLGQLKIADIRPDRRFLVVRAAPEHPDVWLVNRLISDYVPFDFVTRYVFAKQRFYADYAGYAETWRRHVVDTLKQTYLKDKAALRRRLFALR